MEPVPPLIDQSSNSLPNFVGENGCSSTSYSDCYGLADLRGVSKCPLPQFDQTTKYHSVNLPKLVTVTNN